MKNLLTDSVRSWRCVGNQATFQRLWLTVKNIKQSYCQSQEITEAVEAEVDQMPSQFHNLQPIANLQ